MTTAPPEHGFEYPSPGITEDDVSDSLNRRLLLIRRIFAAALVIAAAAVWFLLKPSMEFDGSTYRASLAQALRSDDANQQTAESAPQQQVVNGWTNRDLLAITIREQAAAGDAGADQRVPAELGLAVLGIAGFGSLHRKWY